MLDNLKAVIAELRARIPGLNVDAKDTGRIVETRLGSMPEVIYTIEIEGQLPIVSRSPAPLLSAQNEIAQNIWNRFGKPEDKELLSILSKLGWSPPRGS